MSSARYELRGSLHKKGHFSNDDFIGVDDPTYDDLVENISMCSGSVNEILDQVWNGGYLLVHYCPTSQHMHF